jgi:hypothetical protein
MTLHRLDGEIDWDLWFGRKKLTDENGKEYGVIHTDGKLRFNFMGKEIWDQHFGGYRIQCNWCGLQAPLQEWPGFGLSMDPGSSANSMASFQVKDAPGEEGGVWDDLLNGNAHFCCPEHAGSYFNETITKYAVNISYGPTEGS